MLGLVKCVILNYELFLKMILKTILFDRYEIKWNNSVYIVEHEFYAMKYLDVELGRTRGCTNIWYVN